MPLRFIRDALLSAAAISFHATPLFDELFYDTLPPTCRDYAAMAYYFHAIVIFCRAHSVRRFVHTPVRAPDADVAFFFTRAELRSKDKEARVRAARCHDVITFISRRLMMIILPPLSSMLLY